MLKLRAVKQGHVLVYRVPMKKENVNLNHFLSIANGVLITFVTQVAVSNDSCFDNISFFISVSL